MPRIIGIRERINQIYYSGWIADTREGGAGISPALTFQKEMKLFVTLEHDSQRCNMSFAGQFPGDRSALVKTISVFTSFSDANHAKLCRTMTHALIINKKAVIVNTGTGQVRKHGNIKLVNNNPTQNTVIATRTPFHMLVVSSEEFYLEMKKIERGEYEDTYAEITGILDTIATREVQ